MFRIFFYRGICLTLFATLFASLLSCSSTQQVQSGNASGDIDSNRKSLLQPVDPPFTFERAVRQGTRSRDGKPGSEYWQQWTNYDLQAQLFPKERRLEGQGTITYYNNSPDTLRRMLMELVQNLHSKGNVRNEQTEISGGIDIQSISVDGVTLQADTQKVPNYTVNSTRLILDPVQKLPPGDSTRIHIEWSFNIPSKGASGRMGYDQDNLYYMGYWYPIMSVYDDVSGWFTDPFRGRAEFYFGYGNYDLEITAPSPWVVMSTGKLLNAGEMLAPKILERYRQARQSDEVVHIIQKEDFGQATRPGTDSLLTWKFKADTLRDVAFSATTESRWDAARALIGDRDGDGKNEYTRTDAFYRSDAKKWQEAVPFLQHSIEYLSEYTDYNYPWPHMTAVEGDGIIGGGMEYPMMTVIGPYHEARTTDLYNVIAHELAHMWIPMIAGSNERRYSWMDEGATTFNENNARTDQYPGRDHWQENRRSYLRIAGTGYEGEIMRWSDYHYDGYLFTIASYYKPATVLYALREVLGEDTFNRAYQAFFDRWAYKHPQPWDFFNTFEDISGRELDWFWRSWYYETWVLDQAVKSVDTGTGSSVITIENVGNVPMPVELEITLANGETLQRTISVEQWLDGSTEATLIIGRESPVSRVEIDPDQDSPEANRRNNTWSRQ